MPPDPEEVAEYVEREMMKTITVWDHRRAYEAIAAFERDNPRSVVVASNITFSPKGRRGYILSIVPKPKKEETV